MPETQLTLFNLELLQGLVGITSFSRPKHDRGLSDHDLADRHEILQKTGGQAEPDEDEEPSAEADIEVEEGTGSKVRLRPWNKRIRKSMGYDGDAGTAAGKPAPLIDQVHRMMHLWRAGDLIRVDEYSMRAASAATRCSINSCRR